MKHASQRVGVFIDAANMYHSAKNLHEARLNFKAVVEAAVAGRQLIRAIAYVIKTKTGEEKPFFEALEAGGIEIKEKELQEFYGGAKKADWDVGIAVDAIRIGSVLDVVVIASGDGDFIPLAEYLKNQGRQVEVMGFRETTSSKLIEMADDFTDLSADRKKFLFPMSRSRKNFIMRGGSKVEI